MELVPKADFSIVTRNSSKAWIPELIAAAGPEVSETYIDFFTSTIRNRNTRLAYARACWQFLSGAQLITWNSRPCDRSMWLPDPAHSVRGPKYVVKKGKTPVEPRRCQNAAGFNSKGFGVRFTGPGAYRCDVLQFRLCERSTETHLLFRTPLLWKPGLC